MWLSAADAFAAPPASAAAASAVFLDVGECCCCCCGSSGLLPSDDSNLLRVLGRLLPVRRSMYSANEGVVGRHIHSHTPHHTPTHTNTHHPHTDTAAHGAFTEAMEPLEQTRTTAWRPPPSSPSRILAVKGMIHRTAHSLTAYSPLKTHHQRLTNTVPSTR